MKLRKVVGITALSLSCLSIFTACGNGSNSSSKSDSKEIVFWNPFVGPAGNNFKQMVKEYNETNPDYKVKFIALKEKDMYTKIPTVVNSGKNIPDVTIVHAERLKQYVDNKMLLSYDEFLSEAPEIKSENYVPEAWEMGDIDGKRYSIPMDIHNFCTYYNKDLVEKYAPTALDDNILTFDEIKEAGEKAKEDKIKAVAITWVKPNLLSVIKQEGGELSEDGILPTLDTPQVKESMELLNSLYSDGITAKDGEDATQLFLSGKLMFLPEGIWMQNNYKDAKFEWGMTNAPQVSDDINKIVNWASSHQFVMFNSKERSSEKAKGIVKFIDWIRTNSLEWAKAGQNPATLSILENEEYKKMPQSLFLSSPEEQKSLTVFNYKYNGYVAEYLDANANDAYFGKKKIDDFVTDMQKQVTDKVNKDKSNEK